MAVGQAERERHPYLKMVKRGKWKWRMMASTAVLLPTSANVACGTLRTSMCFIHTDGHASPLMLMPWCVIRASRLFKCSQSQVSQFKVDGDPFNPGNSYEGCMAFYDQSAVLDALLTSFHPP